MNKVAANQYGARMRDITTAVSLRCSVILLLSLCFPSMGLSLEQCEDPGVCFATQATKQAWAEQNQCGFGDDADGLGNDLTEDGTDGPGNGAPKTCAAPDNSLFPGANQNDSFLNSSAVQASDSTLNITPRNGLSDAGASVQTGISATHVGNPIHVVTGNKYQAEKDIDLPGLNFVRHYNSLSTFRGPFGNNWRHGFDVRFIDRGNKVYLWQADGRRIDFTLTGYGENSERLMAPVQQGDGELIITGEQYLWRWENGTELLLLDKKGGRLAKVTSNSGPELLMEYDPQWRLTGVREQWNAHLNSDQPAKQTRKDLDSYTRNQAIRQIAFFYNDDGKLAEANVVGGQHVQYDYDSSGRLYRVRYDDGAERLYHYENDAFPNHLTGVSSGFGESDAEVSGNNGKTKRISTWAYDEQGRAISSARQGRARQNVSLEYRDGETLVTDQDGMISRYVTSMIGGVPHVTEVAGPGCGTCQQGNTEYRYRGGFELVTDTSEREALAAQGNRNRIERDSVNPDGKHVLDITRNEQGLPVTVTETGWTPVEIGKYEEITRTTQYKWDMGRLVERDGPLENGPKGTPEDSDITQYHYNDKGWLIRKTLPMGLTESFEYDQAGRVITSRKKDGIVSSMEYDVRGRLASLSRAGQTITLTYDDQGKIDTIKNLLGQSFLLEHDASGDLVAITDQEGQRITWKYGADGRVNQKRFFDADGALSLKNATDKQDLAALLTDNRSAVVERHNNKRRIRFDSQGRITSYRYDDFGRLVSTHSPVTGKTLYHYDASDNQTLVKYRDGKQIKKAYDAASRLIRRSSDSETVFIEWDDNGRLSRVRHEDDEDGHYTEAFQYNAIGKLSLHRRIYENVKFETGYQYDHYGRLETKILPDGEVIQYRYHPVDHPKAGSLASVERKGLFGSKPLITGINRAGEVINDRGFDFFNGISQRRSLDVEGNVTFAGGPQVAFSQIKWQEVGIGSQLPVTSAVASASNPEGMESDARQNPGHHVIPFHNSHYGKRYNPKVEYRYPATPLPFNERGYLRKSLEVLGVASKFTQKIDPDSQVRPVDWSSANYNQRGELVSDGSRNYQWDEFGRITAVYEKDDSGNQKHVASYRYNFFGERISKTVYAKGSVNQSDGVTTLFMYDGNQIVAEADRNGIQRQYLYLDNRAVLLRKDNQYYPIHTDHRYAPLAVTDEKQRVIWKAKVGDNGASIRNDGAWLTMPLRGSNQYHDDETGLHYNINRYMDPVYGRYLSPDPMGLKVGPDLYSFALGRPHEFVDLAGLEPVGNSDRGTIESVGDYFSKPAANTQTAKPLNGTYARASASSSSADVALSAMGELMLENSLGSYEDSLIKKIYRVDDDCIGDPNERRWVNALDQARHDMYISEVQTLQGFLVTYEITNSKLVSLAMILSNPAAGSVTAILKEVLKSEVQSALLSPGNLMLLATVAEGSNASVGGDPVEYVEITDNDIRIIDEDDFKNLIKEVIDIKLYQAKEFRDQSYLSNAEIQQIEAEKIDAERDIAEIQLRMMYEREVLSYLGAMEELVELAEKQTEIAKQEKIAADKVYDDYLNSVAYGESPLDHERLDNLANDGLEAEANWIAVNRQENKVRELLKQGVEVYDEKIKNINNPIIDLQIYRNTVYQMMVKADGIVSDQALIEGYEVSNES